MKKLLLIIITSNISYLKTSDIKKIRKSEPYYYEILYTNGQRVSIFRNSYGSYTYTTNTQQIHLPGQQGQGIYDEFASLYKQWKATKLTKK